MLSILIAYHHGTLAYIDEDESRDEAFKSKYQLKKSKLTGSNDSLLDGINENQQQDKVSIPASPLKMPLATPVTSMADLHLSMDTNNNNNNNNINMNTTPSRSPTPSSHKRDQSIEATIIDGKEDIEDEDVEYIAECSAVLALMRVLRKGLMMKRQVDNAIEHCSQYYHIKESIYESRTQYENARTAEEGQAYLQEAMRHLRIYTNLICYNAYLYEYYHAKKYNDTVQEKYKLLSFTEWMQSRGELKLWSSKMIQNPQLALSMNEFPLDDEQEEKGFAQVFEQRGKKSSVLSGNAMLKVDYFPGCAQLSTNPDAENAINFRYIDAIGVAGLAIPTS